MPKIKNIIIFLVIGGIFTSIYFFYMKSRSGGGDKSAIVSTSSAPVAPFPGKQDEAAGKEVAQDFINLLLSVQTIQLNDAIFTDEAFQSLDGSNSITLVPDGNEGRPNPFAKFGADSIEMPADALKDEDDGGLELSDLESDLGSSSDVEAEIDSGELPN